MHLSVILGTAAAVLPSVAAFAIEHRSSYLESSVYSASAWVNQQDYNKNKASATKIVEDRTFGMKNKKGGSAQKQIAQMTSNLKGSGSAEQAIFCWLRRWVRSERA